MDEMTTSEVEPANVTDLMMLRSAMRAKTDGFPGVPDGAPWWFVPVADALNEWETLVSLQPAKVNRGDEEGSTVFLATVMKMGIGGGGETVTEDEVWLLLNEWLAVGPFSSAIIRTPLSALDDVAAVFAAAKVFSDTVKLQPQVKPA